MINTLYIVEEDKMRFELVILMPLIDNTINMQIARTASVENAQPAANKNVFSILLSFDL